MESLAPLSNMVDVRALSLLQHAESHGRVYSCHDYFSGFANSAVKNYIIQTGGQPVYIAKSDLYFTGTDLEATIYKSPTVSVAGTGLATYCTNQVINNSAGFSITKDATVTDNGTQVTPTIHMMGSAGSGNASLANLFISDKILLAPNTSYLVRIYNNAGGTQKVTLDLTFGE